MTEQPDFGLSIGPSADTCEVTTTTTELGRPGTNTSPLLAAHTTFGIGGPAKQLVVASTTDELIAAVRDADAADEPLFVLSGGSNVLVADDGFPGVVVVVATKGVTADVSDCGGALVTVAAGEYWDTFVAHAVDQQWVGVEALSGIPGAVGSTPIQNVGAYGQEVAQTIARVRTFDRQTGELRTFAASDCGFGYRDSIFKRSRRPGEATGRYIVLDVTFQFELGRLGAPIAYAELARTLGVDVGTRDESARVREAVLSLRRGKGMVYDPTDADSHSAGSFFMNPLLSPEEAAQLPPEAPRFPTLDGRVKSSAAWLIDHAGFTRGHGEGAAKLSTKHVLALTNTGGASAVEVIELAREIVSGVEAAYGVTLDPEPVIVGLDW